MPRRESNPYVIGSEAEKSDLGTGAEHRRPPRRWWIPFVVSIIITPIAALSEVTYGASHSENIFDRLAEHAVFPLGSVFEKLVDSENLKGLFILLQFPAYGVVVSLCMRKERLIIGCVALAVFHFVVYLYVMMS